MSSSAPYTAVETVAQLVGAAQAALASSTPEGPRVLRSVIDAALSEGADPGELLALTALTAGAAVDVSARAAGIAPDVARRQALAVAELWAGLPR